MRRTRTSKMRSMEDEEELEEEGDKKEKGGRGVDEGRLITA